MGQAISHFDAHQVLGVLVTKLPLDPQSQRGPMGDLERRIIHRVGKDGLRVKCIEQINAFIVPRRAVVRGVVVIRAMEHHVTGVIGQSGLLQKMRHWHTGLLADRTPPFHTVMTRDLGALRLTF